MGPIITPHARNRIIQKIEDAIREGATVALDGRNFSHHLLPNGNWLAPTVSPRHAPLFRTASEIFRFYLGSSLGWPPFKERSSVPSCFVWKQKHWKKRSISLMRINVCLNPLSGRYSHLTDFQMAMVVSFSALVLVPLLTTRIGCSIFTSNGASGRQFQRDVNVGMVSVNNPHNAPQANFSFSSNKASFLGGKSKTLYLASTLRANFRRRNQFLWKRLP